MVGVSSSLARMAISGSYRYLEDILALTLSRLYTQLDISRTKDLSDGGTGQVDIHSITPEEVLEQANRIFSPYKLSFAAPLSWFAIWKSNKCLFHPQCGEVLIFSIVSERVARSFSSDDLRVHLVGDAA